MAPAGRGWVPPRSQRAGQAWAQHDLGLLARGPRRPRRCGDPARRRPAGVSPAAGRDHSWAAGPAARWQSPWRRYWRPVAVWAGPAWPAPSALLSPANGGGAGRRMLACGSTGMAELAVALSL